MPKSVKLQPRAWRYVARFIHAESSGGLLLLAAALLAMVLANSGWSIAYFALVTHNLSFQLGSYVVTHSVADWIKDTGMVLFFLVVGMELKRELSVGVLTDKRQVILPLAAAFGGMLVPAVIFIAFTYDTALLLRGWAIPTATDIAFALAVLLLASRHVPIVLKVFLLSIAIFDDLGAILVIALFYSHAIAWPFLGLAALGVGGLRLLGLREVSTLWPYLLLGAAATALLALAGVHATIGGVITGLAIPMRDRLGSNDSPLNRCMHFLHPWVTFVVLPLFALTAAGVALAGLNVAGMANPITLGVLFGLVVGKPLGILGASWLVIRMRLAELPAETRWGQLAGVALLAGIGFTMSMFITTLGYTDAALQTQAKLGVLAGSLLAALLGAFWLRRSCRA